MTQYVTGGTIAVTNGSPVVTGTLTSFQASLVAEGSILYVKGAAYPIQSVQSDTQLTLKIPYAGTTESGLAYTIGRAEAIQSQTVLNANKTAVLLDNLPVFSQQGKALLQAPDFVAQQAILGFSGTYSFAFDDATAMADPGAGNWLDPAGHEDGYVTFRWMGSSTAPRPLVEQVPLAELATRIEGARGVDPGSREASLRRKRQGILGRFDPL